MDEGGKLVLLDSHALIHRAYHAIRTELLSPGGEPTKAVFGFTSTLLKVLKDLQPRYVAAAFDVGKSFRSDQYVDYKATRPKLAEDLAPQITRVRQVCDALGIPIYAEEGFEADDLLGALSKQASERGIDTIIVTGDTDTLQLINPRTQVQMFLRLGEPLLYDNTKVQEKYALEPHQLVDLKALRGDPSDNIPGVPGIGDKTATRLLQQFGTVEGILDHLGEIDAKTRAKLSASEKQLRLNKHLVTIALDAPVELDLDTALMAGFDRARVLELFRELGFQSLVSRLPESAAEGQSAGAQEPVPHDFPRDYHTVLTENELDGLVSRLLSSHAFVVDVETTGLDEVNAELVGIALGLGQGESYYVPLGHQTSGRASEVHLERRSREAQPALFDKGNEAIRVARSQDESAVPQLDKSLVLRKLASIFSNPRIAKYAHNAKYDLIVLGQAGLETKGLQFDTLIAAHLLEPSGQKLGLKELVFSKFGFQMTEIEGLIGKGKNQITMSEVAVEQAAPYACSDADFTYRLMELYQPQLKERGLDKLFYELEMPLLPVIIDLELAGVLLDVKALAGLSVEIGARLEALERQVYDMVGAPFNLGSPQQLSDALFVKLGLPSSRLERTRTGQISTAAAVLEELRPLHPVVDFILEHRELSKLKGTYVDALPALVSKKDGRLHTSYNQAGTVTGRISSSNPNLQNIPVKSELGRQVRRAFIAPPGRVLLSADYSQVELRILAHVTQDENLLKAFAEGEDIHTSTASKLFNVPLAQVTPQQRRLGKTINFGVVYGISDWGVSGRTELSVEESRRLIDGYFDRYPRVKAYIEQTKEQAHSQGYVESLMGRRRYFRELTSGRRIPLTLRNQAEREAINMPIQATAADIIKRAMVNLHGELASRGLSSRMILQVHDELVIECPQPEAHEVVPLVRRVMEEAYQLDAPLKVDVSAGPNWDQMKRVEE
jgi:DNA polymerase I